MTGDSVANRAEELFHQALRISEDDRDAWLSGECTGSPKLLSLVRTLLRHDLGDVDPLEDGLTMRILSDAGLLGTRGSGLQVRCPHCHQPIELVDDSDLHRVVCSSCGSDFSLVATDDTESDGAMEQKQLGRFCLTERLGSGAFANVYKATDDELGREVAIKVPRKDQISAKEAGKFLREARTVAQLRHPNIVSVHEIGRQDDMVYIVSDLIDGLTLADWMTGGGMTPRESAVMCVKIAQALGHAHQQGVIHRDLKPSNIMLDRSGEPFVTDFGLAKRETAEGTIAMTMDGQVLGTPAYMSPEQAAGNSTSVDHRADIYSVGVILFELLCGERPFRGNTRMVLHQVLTEDPPSPRRYNGTISRDLETICLKCLDKSPGRRYTTSLALAADLQNYLEHRPIAARPVGPIPRTWRLCKRKPLVVGLSAMLVLAMLVGTAASSYFALQANREAGKLAASLKQEQSLVIEKNTLLVDKEALITDLEASHSKAKVAKQAALNRSEETGAVLKFFRDNVLVVTRPEGEENGLGFDATVREAIDAAEPLIQPSFRNQPVVESAVRQMLAESYHYLGQYDAAIAQLEIARDIRTKHLGAGHPDTLSTMLQLTKSRIGAGQVQTALREAERSLQIATEALGDENLSTLLLTSALGDAYRSQGRLTESLQLLESARQRLIDGWGMDHPATIDVTSRLASAYVTAGRIREAIRLNEQGLEDAEKAFGPTHSETLRHLQNLAFSYSVAGRLNDAILLYERVLETKTEKLGDRHPSTLLTMTTLANSYRNANRGKDSIATLENARELIGDRLSDNHPGMFAVINSLAWAYSDAGKVDKSIQLMEPMVQRAKQVLGESHEDTYSYFYSLSQFYSNVDRKEDSYASQNPMLRHFVHMARSTDGQTNQLRFALKLLARNLLAQNQYEAAEPVCRECLSEFSKPDSDAWQKHQLMYMLGQSLAGQGKYRQAKETLVDAFNGLVDEIDRLPEHTDVDFAELMEAISIACHQLGQHDKEDQWSAKLVSHQQTTTLGNVLRQRASQAADAGRLSEAVELYEAADRLPLQRAPHQLARIYARSSQWEKAKQTFSHAFPTKSSFQLLAMLYRLGELESFREQRRLVLEDYTDVSLRWQYFDDLRMSLLLPIDQSAGGKLDEKQVGQVEFLVAANENRSNDPECLELVGKGMYRLGRFMNWYKSLPLDSPLRTGQELLVATCSYRESPSDLTRQRLEEQISLHIERAERFLYDNINFAQWPKYIEQIAWLREATSVLRGTDRNLPDPPWPDESVDLMVVSKQLQGLRDRAFEIAESGETPEEAITLYEQLAQAPWQSPDLMLVNLYARTGQWDRAIEVATSQPGYVDWRTPLLLHKTGRLDEARRVRKCLLTGDNFRDHPSYQFQQARSVILMPIETELIESVQHLIDVNADPQVRERWRKILVGPMIYRRGDFVQWHQQLPDDSPLRSDDELLVAMTRFQNNASDENRSLLINQLDRVQTHRRIRDARGDLGKYWFDHVWRDALADEAAALLRYPPSPGR